MEEGVNNLETRRDSKLGLDVPVQQNLWRPDWLAELCFLPIIMPKIRGQEHKGRI